MKMLKKILVMILLILMVVASVFFIVDKKRFLKKKAPIFSIRRESEDETKVTYIGLGYKIVTYPEGTPKQEFKKIKHKKIVPWFGDYKKPSKKAKEKAKAKKVSIKTQDEFYKYLGSKKIKAKKPTDKFNKEDAKNNKYYIFENGMETNREKLDEFMKKYSENENAFLEIAKVTEKGDLILYHIIYEKGAKKLYIIVDTKRDQSLDKKLRKIELYKLDKIEIKEENSKKKFVSFESKESRPELDSFRSMTITEVK